MGDVGDYWREHREYQRRRASADSLGMSMSEYARWERQCRREEGENQRRRNLDRCTVRCECGKWLLDAAAHASHKRARGKRGHSIAETKEPAPAPEDPFDIGGL